MLYRPFLHYVSQKFKTSHTDPRAYACASACVSVSRNIIHITTEMKKRKLLVGAYWFIMYTTFFGIMSLVYFALENPDNPTTQELLRDAKEGKEVLGKLAKRSMAADRCAITLAVRLSPRQLFPTLANFKLGLVRTNRRAPRKRARKTRSNEETTSAVSGPANYPEKYRSSSCILRIWTSSSRKLVS